jgi:hypothetical protein
MVIVIRFLQLQQQISCMSKLLLRELLQLIKISNYSLQSGTQMIVLPCSSIIMVLKTACSGARLFLVHQQLLQHFLENGMLWMILFLSTIAPVLS